MRSNYITVTALAEHWHISPQRVRQIAKATNVYLLKGAEGQMMLRDDAKDIENDHWDLLLSHMTATKKARHLREELARQMTFDY